MVGDDQFSFPVVTNSVSHPMQSPPLWRISSVVYHHDKEEDTAMEREVSSRREEGRGKAVEEKIDMLWQDLFCEEQLGCGAECMGELEVEAGEAQGTRTSWKQLCKYRGGGVMVSVAIMKLLKKVHLRSVTTRLISNRREQTLISCSCLNFDTYKELQFLGIKNHQRRIIGLLNILEHLQDSAKV